VFQLLGGHLALDFVNTLDNRYSIEGATDLLASYDDLIFFLLEANVVSASQARGLRRQHSRKDEALEEGRSLREALCRIFTATVHSKNAALSDLRLANEFVGQSLSHRVIEAEGREFVWRWSGLGETANSALWPIAYAAAELLVSPARELVRECQNGECRWLFLDASKNHSRRWCDMKVCGNRTKSRRYYERHFSA
jgi:predicted RNA-binding Zn ribbon-like protein